MLVVVSHCHRPIVVVVILRSFASIIIGSIIIVSARVERDKSSPALVRFERRVNDAAEVKGRRDGGAQVEVECKV